MYTLNVEIMTVDSQPVIRPRCLNSERACLLVKRSYLTAEELKILELMGFEIIVEDRQKKD